MGLLNRLQLAYYVLKGMDVGGWHVGRFNEGRAYAPDRNYHTLVKKYIGWVYTCANMNATNCAQVPLRLYGQKTNKKQKSRFPVKKVPAGRMKFLSSSPSTYRNVVKAVEIEEITEHPFLELLTNVNEFMNGFELLEMMFLSQELTGNAYWKLSFDSGLGIPTDIFPLFPQYMKVIPDKEKFIAGWEYRPTMNEKHIIEPEEIIQFKYVSMKNAFYGYSPLEAIIIAADLSTGMNTYEATLMMNSAVPDYALMLPEEAGEPNPDEQKRMLKDWKKQNAGKKQGGLTILTGGAELKQLALSPKEMAFLKGREATLNEIAAAFGVPMSKLTSKNVNRANAEAGNAQYQSDAILPRLRKVEQKLNERLLPLYDESLFCAFDNPVPEDKEFKLKERTANLKTGFSSINLERQLEGQEPVIWGEVPLMPQNILPLGTEIATESVAIEEVKAKSKANKASLQLPPLGRPANNFINEELVAEIRSFFEEQAKEILDGFDKDAESIAVYIDSKSPADNFTSSWFDMQKWDKKLAAKTEPFTRATFLAGGEAAIRQVAADQLFDSFSPAVMRELAIHRSGKLVAVNRTTVKRIRKQLADGIEANESLSTIRKRIEGEFDYAAKHRAAVVARTEVIWAWNAGAKEGYKQSGVVKKIVWVSTGDERTCEFCPDLDGEVIEIETTYFDKGDSMEGNEGGTLNFDYESVGHPPLHPMCRCTIAAVIENV